ncbi:phage holin family protein [Streptomyces griseoaurantiacus]|uniref:Phage holin family protein n=2 Tax=Streptomyces griseoaurantiacus TaxID=68213 RepID=A0A7W2DP64_9ACTN|nr:phage holin family protein [Streptomyces griseoaurantiacus]MBA5220456.1 phage holin family protein [Streptomyces griseoaurantiacus]
MRREHWRSLFRGALRSITVWAVSTLTMLLLAGILPDFKLQSDTGDSATRIAVTAAAGAGVFGLLSALVWPLLVRLLLLVPALVLGLLVFFLNGSLLLVALRLNPSGRGEAAPETAVVVAAVMSAVASATGAALAVRDDDAYRRRLYRLADRRRRRAAARTGPSSPGTVFLQLDGVGHDVLTDAVLKGLMPTVAGWLGVGAGTPGVPAARRDGSEDAVVTPATVPGTAPAQDAAASAPTHRLIPWRTDWSSQTGASQLGILHGSNHDVPAFRWYEKDTGETVVANRPTSAADLQRRAEERAGHAGLLAVDGASRGNLFSGGAGEQALVLSIAIRRRGRANRSRAGYFAYFSDPANAVRTALSFVAEVCREITESTRARLRKERPRVGRGGLYPLIRAFATVVERDVVVAAVMGDMLAGRTAVYADLVAYDEVAHHSGPHSRDAGKVLARLDRALALIAHVAERAPRPYRIVVLSDHGQSPGETFQTRYGLGLGDLVRAGCGLPVPRRAQRTHSGAEARAAVRAALRRPVEEDTDRPRHTACAPARQDGRPAPRPAGEPVVLASGNLGLVSFPDVPHRMSREEIDRRHPALLSTLANHPGIGFLLVRSEEHGGVVLAAHGAEVPVDELSEAHPGPLADFGPGAAEAVRRTHSFPHTADIMVNSWYDPAEGEVLAFEEQIGSHGGLGGAQGRPFLLSPLEFSPPVAEGAELVGAEEVHRVLARWLRECDGPQIPLGPGRGTVVPRPAGRDRAATGDDADERAA